MKWLLVLLALIGLGSFQLRPASAQQWFPGGDGVPIVCAYNSSPPVVASGRWVYAQCNSSGTLLGTGGGGGGGGTSSNFGAAFPAAGTAAGFSDGTNMVAIQISTWGTTPTGLAALPVNANVLVSALPAGASTSALQTSGNTSLTTIATETTATAGSTATTATNTGTTATNTGITATNTAAVNRTPTACDSTITAGGTAQTAITAQTTLHGFTITNNDPTHGSGEPLWISFTATAVQSAGTGSNPLAAPTATTYAGMGSYTTPPGFGSNHLVSVIAATTGHTFGCFWW